MSHTGLNQQTMSVNPEPGLFWPLPQSSTADEKFEQVHRLTTNDSGGLGLVSLWDHNKNPENLQPDPLGLLRNMLSSGKSNCWGFFQFFQGLGFMLFDQVIL